MSAEPLPQLERDDSRSSSLVHDIARLRSELLAAWARLDLAVGREVARTPNIGPFSPNVGNQGTEP